MKYYKVLFSITDCRENTTSDPVILQTARDLLCALAAEAGFESFEETGNGLCGYVQQQAFSKTLLDEAVNAVPLENISVTYNVSEAEDKDWNIEWETNGFEPIKIGGRCVIHDTRHSAKPADCNMLDITIDARQAFGTGTHDTTQMISACLLEMNLDGKNVLDCGCGTGILSIVAAKCGARNVTAYDIDRWSVENTKHNCELNNVQNVKVVEGSSDIISSLNKNFNFILANINRNILLADMSKFRSAMAAEAFLILSGFYTEDAPLLKEKAKSLGLNFVKAADHNKWCMLVFKKD